MKVLKRSRRDKRNPANSRSPAPSPRSEGWSGWDEYAPFYDWENARTLGRRDVAFWRRVAAAARGPVLELGCGTGRISIPLARSGIRLIGIDRSASMLARASRRARRLRGRAAHGGSGAVNLLQGDIRALPFRRGAFAMVLAPYGVLQSLLSNRDVQETLDAVGRILEPGGLLGIDLVPDVPAWREYRNRVKLRGRTTGGAHLTLVESVRQDTRRRLTTFEQRYVKRRGRRAEHYRFELKFRTLPLQHMAKLVERAGFVIESVLGDYRGRPWDERADTWVILARRLKSEV